MIYGLETTTQIDPWLNRGYHDLPFETYCEIPAANSHGLMDIRNKSPKYYQWKKSKPRTTDSMAFGTLVHWIILEPKVLEERMCLKKTVDGRTKEGKAYNADFQASLLPHQVAVDEETYDKVRFVRDQLAAHPYTSKLIGKGLSEQVGCWVHNETQVFCKTRLDKLFPKEGWIIDVKTTYDASPRAFQKQMVNLDYDLQAAFYMKGFEYIYKRRPEGYIYLCVENTEPHDIAIYTPEQTVIDHGNYKFQQGLMTYAECVKSGQWPGYEPRAVPMELPGWAVYMEQE